MSQSASSEKTTLIIGGGLAGLSCAFELAEQGKSVIVLEAAPYVGGRTANWNERGMEVESGFHKFIGYYTLLPELLERAGIDLDEMLFWETSMEARHPEAEDSGEFGLDVIRAPLKTLLGALGNNSYLTPADKASLIPFFTAGFKDYLANPEKLDEIPLQQYAEDHHVTPQALERILEPLSSGIFFLPPDQYSSYAFFGLFAPGIPRLHKMRIGAFSGGMTDVMCQPLADRIEQLGGKVRTSTPVRHLIVEHNRISGVELENGERLLAENVVVATNIRRAQKLLTEHFSEVSWFKPFFELESMPHVTAQFQLPEPLLPQDRTTFGPGTQLGSFGEQSRTTFRDHAGRTSIILVDPDKLVDLPDEQVWKRTVDSLHDIGLDGVDQATDYRIIRGDENFYRLSPGNEKKRPKQVTPIPGLFLAGDYTKQPFLATMEGAVISGQRAARGILNG
ncbi:FAD-dependent oxidoreductase [Saccharibacillus sp. JS10]|uniref:hydroxysqualene dehydroxylase n=1 Tax=Saccharibacillus sp. JS10 TaxID=2950552 RepID=UPI00210ED91A|nr:FAD-dependent oxidoreductase [Saccharibacillus sp. JS10]MCQ4087946.1 FAD-dependent oxidoreductase [Saccharibacillus sp. JS10]